MTAVTERLPGCTAQSLDSYLRGLGFFLLAGEVEPAVRAWWDEDGFLCVASSLGLEGLTAQVIKKLQRDPPPLRMPWRGKDGRDQDFAEARNDAPESELDWFDACALPRPAAAPDRRPAGRERSDRENNPLLGQGGSFGRSDPQAAYEDALATIQADKLASAQLTDALLATLRGEPFDARLTRQLSTTKAVLGAYQSGRGTGAGSSARDVVPARQATRSNAWDVVIVFTGLRLFRGTPSRRPDPRARVQASFPFLVRSRPIGTGPGGVHELRVDDPQAFEFLAPLWSSPCPPRILRHLVSSARLRLRYGTAQDTLDAVLVQASRATRSLGFDRLVRFALVAGSDPRYRFAVRRGEVHAAGLRSARKAVDEIVPFVRAVERTVREEPPSLMVAKRRLEDTLAEFGRKSSRPRGSTASEPSSAQEALIALALLQAPAALAAPELAAPRLSPEWHQLADDSSAEYRLVRSLLAGLTAPGGSNLLRETILPHRRDDRGRFVLDPKRTSAQLEHVADPVATLVELYLSALHRTRDENIIRVRSARFQDVVLLLAGELGQEGERKIALLCAALAGVDSAEPPPAAPGDPLTAGIGSRVATLLLAAQRAEEEDSDRPAIERAANLASLMLAGRVEMAGIASDRELRRRGLDLLPSPLVGSSFPRPALLALAVLLPFDREARSALERVVSLQKGVST